MSGAARIFPRSTASFSMPCRLTAVLWPAQAVSAAALWTWIPRIFARTFWGRRSTPSPTRMLPETRVPVITVPNPRMVKTRSMGSLKNPDSGRSSMGAMIFSRAARSSGSPCPVTEDRGMMGLSSRKVSFRKSRISSMTSSIHSRSTRSDLVTATRPVRIPRRLQMSRCSRVWGMTPSSAAMTRTTRSIPPAPATMFFTNLSWPGTSTTPMTSPPGRVSLANPSSMVMPRSFSSFRRSVSMPVRALMSEVFPWSTWPAVPRMICFMNLVPVP